MASDAKGLGAARPPPALVEEDPLAVAPAPAEGAAGMAERGLGTVQERAALGAGVVCCGAIGAVVGTAVEAVVVVEAVAGRGFTGPCG